MITNYFDIWKVLAGLAIFLSGNKSLEDALKKLAGRPFKLFLKKQASRKLTAISSGAVVAGILQSSSVVNMMVLGFVGAGILNMSNALAVMLGSNVGTTLYSWLVALLGFKLHVTNFIYPITGISGIAMFLLNEDKKPHQWFKFIFGLSFLFVGLDLIRDGIQNMVLHIDLTMLTGYPVVLFTLAGFLITVLIQSSSATMVIVLSALFAHAIPLYAAMAVVLGAETGTTIKLMLASIGGIPNKKRVALGNFLFNAITAVVVLLLLTPVYELITNVFNIKNDLIALVFFQSLVNIITIILFLPFLKPLGNFLDNRFKNNETITRFIHKVTTTEVDVAIEALEKEISRFIHLVIAFCKEELSIAILIEGNSTAEEKFHEKSISEKYDYIKEVQGNIHTFYVGLQNNVVTADITQRLDMLMSAMHNSMYAAKSIKDSYSDTQQLYNSSNDIKHGLYIATRERMAGFFNSIEQLLKQKNISGYPEELNAISKRIHDDYASMLSGLYNKASYSYLNEIELSTIINFNRELSTSQDALLSAVKEFLLDANNARLFEERQHL